MAVEQMISDFFYWASKYIFLSQVLISLVVSGVSEWLLFNANSGIFQLYHDKNKLIFNEMMRSALFYSLHSGTLFWFWADQSFSLMLRA